jgi:hypothetical protein
MTTPIIVYSGFRPRSGLKYWVSGLSDKAGLGDCTAEARPSIGSGRGELVEPLRTLSKEVLIKKFSDL